MTRKLKMLGMAFVAVLALTAVMASAASAASYTSSAYPTTGTATSTLGNDIFKTEAGNVECKSHFAATLEASSESLTVTPTYTECKAFGFVNATVNMNGCDYVFNGPTGSVDTYSATVNVSCPAGKAVEITAGTCKVTIGSQGPLSKVNLTNDTAAGDVNVQAAVGGIAYTVVTDGFGCPFAGTGAKAGATYNQTNAVTFDAASPATATIDIG